MQFNDKKKVGIYTVTRDVTEADIENLIVTAFECQGIYYWAGLDNTGPDWEAKPDGIPLSQWAARVILDGKDVKLCDVEETEDDSEWKLNLPNILRGMGQNAKEHPEDPDIENGDADTADRIIQYALFDKIVFG